MKRKIPKILVGGIVAGLIALATTSAESGTVQQEMVRGEREREWALVYFESWRQNRDGDYLVLSRDHLASAIQIWFETQVQIGHSYPDFYELDRRRREGCLLLAELDRLARKFSVTNSNTTTRGCFGSG